MGTTATSCKQANMYQSFSLLLLVSSLSNVFCQRPTGLGVYPPSPPPPPPAQYPTPAPVQDYNPDIGQTNVGATAGTKTPTATRWRRSSSRTSVSLIRRKLAGHKTRRSAVQLCTRTVPESSRPTLSASASM